MKSVSVQELKQEMAGLKPAELANLILRLARFKKENKELLTYLLYHAQDEEGFIQLVKEEIKELFTTVNRTQLYFAKKNLRKILRVINKNSRYSGNKQTDTELRLFFCRQLKESGIPFEKNAALNKLYIGQLKKTRASMAALHEDLQHDYRKEIAELENKNLVNPHH